MSQRPKRSQRRNPRFEELEYSDIDETQRPAKRRPNRDDEEEEDYAPGGGNDEEDPEDHDIEDGDVANNEDEVEDQPGSSKGRKRQSKSKSAPKNNNQPRTHVRVQQQIDDTGPITVSRSAMQHADNLIVKYNNDAKQLLQDALNRGGGPTRQGIDALVRLVVRHVIFSNTEKPGIPISRTELTKVVSENSAGFSKRPGLPSLIICIAQSKLAECFGMEMVELTKPSARGAKDRVAGAPPTAAAAAAGGPGGSKEEGSKHFVLRSIVPPALYAAVVAKKDSAVSNGFLAVILSIIDMAGGGIEEKELWKHLGDLAVEKAVEHPQLGMPQELVEEFIKRRQLHVERVSGNDGVEVYYSIAENAASELGNEGLKQFYEAEFS